jgi:ribosomal protein L24
MLHEGDEVIISQGPHTGLLGKVFRSYSETHLLVTLPSGETIATAERAVEKFTQR